MALMDLRCATGREREGGAGLVLIVGVIAALAISAATLVALTFNVQGNTSDTRQHVKSFTVCEAGLDAGMAMLSSSWPKTSTSIPTFNTTAFRSRFGLSDFANPSTGQFIIVDWYDDQDPVDTTIRYDRGGRDSQTPRTASCGWSPRPRSATVLRASSPRSSAIT